MNKMLGINEKNRKLLESLNRFGKKLFSIEDASRIIGLPTGETRYYLAYFTRRGWLARVKRGLYVTVPLGTVNPQEYRENPLVVANQVFSPCYIGGWSAAEHWNLTDQIFNSVFVCTYRTFRRKSVNVQGTDFVLKLVREEKAGHTRGVWIENVRIQISDPSQTILDILDTPPAGGGIRHVAEVVENYFSSEHRNDAQLLEYVKKHRNRTVYKRLGYIIETRAIPSAETMKECHKNISSGYSVLDASIKRKGTFNRRWNLRINADIKR